MANSEDDGNSTSQVPKCNRGGNYHCCVPMCNGDSRYNISLSFHRIPKDDQRRKQWVVKIRRDIGPYFTITSKTRVCSKHFKEEDYRPIDKSGRRFLKEGTVPSEFHWTATRIIRRKKRLRPEICESDMDDLVDDGSTEENRAPSCSEELQQTNS